MTEHPGQILRRDFMEPLGISASRLSRGLGVNRSTVGRLIGGAQPLTPALAARLGAFFRVPARWWLLMQAEYDAHAVTSDPTLVDGVTPLEPDPDVILTPKGVLRLAAPEARPAEARVSISRRDLEALPDVPSKPAHRVARVVRFEGGSLALIGDGS